MNVVARQARSPQEHDASADIPIGPANVPDLQTVRAANLSLTKMSDALDAFRFSPWRAWVGGDCPVKSYIVPQVRYRSGGTTEMQASKVRWSHTGAWDDVMAYRTRHPVMPGICP